jgi:hypothetical protein
MILYKDGDFYTLYSAYIGIMVPSFPTAPTATDASVPFWQKHALAWGHRKSNLERRRMSGLGYITYGIDEEKSAFYYDITTHQPSLHIPTGLDRNVQWRQTNIWKVDIDTVRLFLANINGSPIFIFGNGDNIEDVWDLSNEIIVLTLNTEDTHLRLTNRTSNSFESHPGELDLAEQMGQAIFEKSQKCDSHKVHYVDGGQSIDAVMKDILRIEIQS